MAIYHLSAQLIKRSEGRSAVACAAYRAGVALRDERTGESFDYSRRRTHIESCIMLPLGSPPELLDRSTLWNAVEAAEKRRDAQLSRELVVALPVELSRDEQGALVEDFVSKLVETTGVGADMSIHDSGDGNPHAHIMLTLRTIDAAGLSPKKNRALNTPAILMEWRKDWAEATNWALAQAGRSERIDHRSHADRGLKSPPSVHLGVAAAAMERRGIPTRLGDHNRAAAAAAAELTDARRHVKALTLLTQLIEKARAWSRRRLELRAVRMRRQKAAQQQKQTREAQPLSRLPVSSRRPSQPRRDRYLGR